jgi:hypothetical protein
MRLTGGQLDAAGVNVIDMNAPRQDARDYQTRVAMRQAQSYDRSAIGRCARGALQLAERSRAMGQAGAAPQTHSDPNEPAITAASSADELLAQLAGEEIDRLLAETEDGGGPGASAVMPTPVTQADAPASSPPVDLPVNAGDTSIDAVEKIGDQLDQLLKEIEKPGDKAEPPAATTTIAQLGAATGTDEVTALLGERIGSREPDVIEDGSSLPWYVRCLEVLNLPFAPLPDALREFLGKVAILTLFNSVAVLLYVLIFRPQ